jgi:hypothetical protein
MVRVFGASKVISGTRRTAGGWASKPAPAVITTSHMTANAGNACFQNDPEFAGSSRRGEPAIIAPAPAAALPP